jgi:hypothetical protein
MPQPPRAVGILQPFRPVRSIWLLPLLAACAVEADDTVDDPVFVDGKEDRGDRVFVEVDPTHSSATFRRYITQAIAMLERDDSDIARLTAQSIRAGRVRIDELADLTCHDRVRVFEEVESLDELDGYMWSNRIYVARGMPTRRLAATLVHEVNHVINQSEVGYWDDLPDSAFVHEYRAFHAESLFDPDEYEGVDLVDHVIELYELDRGAMDPAVLADPLTPRLLPDAAAWSARRVDLDTPDPNDCSRPPP